MTDKNNVAAVTPGSLRVLMLDPSGSSVNSTHNLCNHLARLNCDIQVFTSPHWLRITGNEPGGAYRKQIMFSRGTQLRSYGARTVVSKLFWRVFRLAQHVFAMLKVCSIAKQFDLVHTQILPVPVFDFFCLWFISRRTPVISTVHELVPHGSKFRKMTGLAFKKLYRLASVLFVFADCTREKLIHECGIAPGKIVKIPHGNAEHMLGYEADPEGDSSASPNVLFIGGIRPDKGLDVLIESAAILRTKFPDFKIRVAGTPGVDMTLIHKLIADLKLENFVELNLGFVPEPKFANYLRAATVVALPYRRIEQSGIAAAACTFGKAMVATRCGGLEELITEAGNGLLVPIDDPSAFADALFVLLSDPDKRKAYEMRSRIYAEQNLSWSSIAAKTVTAYEGTLNRRAGLPGQVCAQA